MKKFITDIHTHSRFSFDGLDELKDILARAQEIGVDFYGVSEHVDYDLQLKHGATEYAFDAERYFHDARHLQEDYAGVMNVLIGVELAYARDARVQAYVKELVAQYTPDFVINSIHSLNGDDYYDGVPFYNEDGTLRDLKTVYGEYLDLVAESLHCPYHYDIVGHIGYPTRYAPQEDKALRYADFSDKIDTILHTIIEKNKILEVNASRGLDGLLPSDALLRRYFALGGRNVSYGSDTHGMQGICKERECVTAYLKDIGFTHIIVPCKGEYIKVEL